MRWLALWAMGIVLGISSLAQANGSFSHVHISELAVGALAPGALKTLMMDPENRRAFRAGSMFPDSGYAISDDYGEFAHWSPFLMSYLEDIRMRYGGDYTSAEAQREVAFLMGIASHGLSDQVYDTTLLARAFEIDGPETEERPADVYADYFLVVDQGQRTGVEAWAPYPELPTVFASGNDYVVTEETLMQGMQRMQAVIDLQILVADSLYAASWETYPWLGTHIYNLEAIGSLPWTGEVVARYWETIYRRLEGTASLDRDLVVATYPEDGGVNWPVSEVERGALGKVGLFFGYGVLRSEVAERVTMRPMGGEAIPIGFETAYGGEDRNLVFVIPEDELAYDTEYEVRIEAGLPTIAGPVSTEPYAFSFRTRCADESLADCPPLAPALVASDPPARPPAAVDAGAEPGAEVPPREPTGCGCAIGARPRVGAIRMSLLWLVGWLFYRRRLTG